MYIVCSMFCLLPFCLPPPSPACCSRAMPPRKKRRPSAGDDMSAKKSRQDRWDSSSLRIFKCYCFKDHLTRMLKSQCLSQICRSTFKEYAHTFLKKKIFCLCNWENSQESIFSIITLAPSVLCRLYCCCDFDNNPLIICSVFRKHETSQIREEETFSSKRCLEWFYEYAGEVSYFKAPCHIIKHSRFTADQWHSFVAPHVRLRLYVATTL